MSTTGPRLKRLSGEAIRSLPGAEPAPAAPAHVDPSSRSREAVLEAVRAAGIVGMGGGGFPTHSKLDVSVEWVLVNGCESEPLVCGDGRVLEEHGEEVSCGLGWAMRATGASQGQIVTGEGRYPDGYEKLLVRKTLGREVPKGERPPAVGAVVINVQTARALCHALCGGHPLRERVLTVEGGGVARPGNYRVAFGTPVAAVLEACGLEDGAQIVVGGPMTGRVAAPEDLVEATTIGLLALTAAEVTRPGAGPCIRCSRCQDVCPYGLPVGLLVDRPRRAVEICIGCGACEFVCPAGRPLTGMMRRALEAI